MYNYDALGTRHNAAEKKLGRANAATLERSGASPRDSPSRSSASSMPRRSWSTATSTSATATIPTVLTRSRRTAN